MTYVDPTEFEWQAVKDKDGARIEVRCPLCGAILFEALTNLQDAESPADIIGDILQGHWEMKLCTSPAPIIDLMQAMPEAAESPIVVEDEDGELIAEGETILDVVVKGYDGRLWHVCVVTDEFGDAQRNVEMLPSALDINYAIALEEATRRAAEYRVGMYKLLETYYTAQPTT